MKDSLQLIMIHMTTTKRYTLFRFVIFSIAE